MDHSYTGDKYKDWIDCVFKSNLMDGDLHLTECDNWKLALTNIAKNHLEKKILIWIIHSLILRNLLKIYHIMTTDYRGS